LIKPVVTDLQGPPSERTPEQKLWDFKTRAQQYARDRESCDDTRISYLEFLETEAEDDLALARIVTDLQGPPSERTPEQKLWDFKTRAQQYARDRESCDDVRISYLEFLETEAEDDLALARMIAG
jgi:hypothetical protein